MCLNNYILYSNPLESSVEIIDSNTNYISKKTKHYFIENKVLYSFGSELKLGINQYGDSFPSQTYNTLVDRIWGVYENDPKYRIAITKLLEGGLTKGMFEKYLVNIVKYIFNPVTMDNKVRIYINYTKKKKKKKKKIRKIKKKSLFFLFNCIYNIFLTMY